MPDSTTRRRLGTLGGVSGVPDETDARGGDLPRRPAGPPRERPTLPDVTQDELDVGWGDEPSRRDDDWYRRERPPHHE